MTLWAQLFEGSLLAEVSHDEAKMRERITSKRYKFASKRTLDYSPKKYPVYASNWLVVTDSSESRNGERHGSSCRMQYLIILLGL